MRTPTLAYLSIIAIALCLCLQSCKARNDATSKVKRVQYSQAKAAESATRACQSTTELTSRNLCFLAEYSKQLLSQSSDYDDITTQVNEKLSRKGVTKFLPMSRFRISPKPGGTCFSHDSNPIEAESFWNNQVEPIRKQIENVAEFLAQYHVDMDGQDPGPFGIQDVELCPITVTEGRKIALHGSTLTLGLPVKGIVSKTYGWYSFIELRKMWDSGDIFEKSYSIKQAATDLFAGRQTPFVWILGNPVGQARSALRQFLKNQGGELLSKLDRLISSSSQLSPKDRAKSISSILSLDPSDESSKKFYAPAALTYSSSELQEILESSKGEELLQEWKCQTEKILASSEIANAAIGGLVERSDSTNVNYDIKASWVAVANFHNINVDVLGAFANHSQFIETPRTNEQKFNFEVKAQGKVVVVTGDQVNVTAALNVLLASVQRTIYSESLFQTMKNISKVPDKGQWCVSQQSR
jgi:hypothetical protein